MEQHEVVCRYRPIGEVSVRDIVRMYQVFAGYYENAPLDTFLADMSRKTGVFLVQRRRDDRIVGFSTVNVFDMDIAGRRSRGIFSGDTLIEREYWGSRALQRAFFAFVVRERLMRPLTPLYWCLISKGFKTYLLLANNFPRYYPHPRGENAGLAEVTRDYCRQLFPGKLDEERMLLDFGDGYMYLKSDVAVITNSMRQRYEKIRFFEQCNPSWERGTELPCVGVVGWSDIGRFLRSGFRKMVARHAVAVPDGDQA